MRVLLAEDRPELRRLFRRTLEGLGHVVCDVASTGALRTRLRSFRPQLILCDVDLSGEDGIEACQNARAPVLMMTGDPYHAGRASRAGFAVLLKPFMAGELEAAIAGIIARRR